ncbi:putative membrane protein [Kitasatospora sp. GAS204A]|uniref:PH domain-containing protein n=1 Tax=unclassified Kitasatospora TaxID=2633591 RepID=UPI002473E3AE|nr:PH domain-containing protein [Kitasatospora sp. GAS204B]MDH6117449.1 putative membrane protein [Kitasatospora sp. GAS204B]
MSTATQDPTEVAEPAEPAWRRLSPRLIPVHLAWLVPPVVTTTGTLLGTGGRLNLQALITLSSFTVAFLTVAGINLTRLFTTGYRITDERLELRSGLLFRSHRAVPLDRIRSADVTARPLHRLLGLATVHVGAAVHGTSAGRALRLDGLTVAQAGALRQELLNRRGALLAEGPADAEPDAPIAQLSWRWLRYAPLTIWGVGGLFAALGIGYNTLHDMQIDPLKLGLVHQLVAAFSSVPLWVAVPALLLVLVVLGTVASVGQYVEGWFGYRLEREDGGVLRVRRGLWIHRSVSLDERRLRGIELAEPLLLRLGGGARLLAIATGLGNAEENRTRSVLLPPAPRAQALRVAAEILPDGQALPITAELTPHPRSARRRRINRAVGVVALTAGALALPGIWVSQFLPLACAVAVVLLPLALLLAVDAHRALGHALVGRYLVVRSGTFARRTVALERAAVIGWTVSQSPFQRRLGLLTLTAATAAGRGAYRVRDIAVADGLALAARAVPQLLDPFLEQG